MTPHTTTEPTLFFAPPLQLSSPPLPPHRRTHTSYNTIHHRNALMMLELRVLYTLHNLSVIDYTVQDRKETVFFSDLPDGMKDRESMC